MTATAAIAPSFQTTPVQDRLIHAIQDGESRIIGFGGGIRGTKTWGSLAALITLCRVYPGSRWAVIRKDLQRVRDTVVPSFEKLRLRSGGFVGPINQGDWTATCTNGSQILFRGENIDKDPELLRFHGYEVNGFLNEEADELSERTLTKEIERAGTWIIPGDVPQPPAYILNTFNPCAGWPRRRFYIPWRDGSIQAPYAFIPTTAADNPYISDQQREAWTHLPDNEYRRFVLGDWEALTGAYYDTISPALLIDRSTLPDELPSTWRFWGSFDWGYGHWAVMGAWATTPDGLDILLDSCWLRKQQDAELATAFLEALPRDCLKLVYAGHDCWGKVTAHAASGESTADIFAKAGILLVRADIDKVNGGRAVNGQVKEQRVLMVKTPANLRGYDQLTEILPDENDIRKPAKVDADSEGVGGDDFADMFRYGIATRIAGRKAQASLPYKKPNTADRLTVKDGVLVAPRREPSNIADLETLLSRARKDRLPMRTRLPRR